KCGCPFRLTLRYHKKDGLWHLNHTNPTHEGHEASPIFTHPQYRRLTIQQFNYVDELSKAGAKALHIVAALRERWPECCVIRRDIYNAQALLRERDLKGRTPIQALLDELK
ncbi:hypothetical protein BJ508DRAFT_197226, partial [Ascobolus immersus RN42]